MRSGSKVANNYSRVGRLSGGGGGFAFIKTTVGMFFVDGLYR
jgi:hypothetical protein